MLGMDACVCVQCQWERERESWAKLRARREQSVRAIVVVVVAVCVCERMSVGETEQLQRSVSGMLRRDAMRDGGKSKTQEWEGAGTLLFVGEGAM